MVFGGYSFETHTKTKDEGIEYDQKQLASGELMEVSNLPYLTPIDSHNIKLVNGDIFYNPEDHRFCIRNQKL